jgi:DNA-binding transcriptional ArsR family regulator
MQLFSCISEFTWYMDKIFKALADGTRRKLLDRLHKQSGQTLSELCQHLNMSRQAVTKHLVQLEKANLIVVQWKGREKIHYLNPVPIHHIFERWVSKYEVTHLTVLGNLKINLEK